MRPVPLSSKAEIAGYIAGKDGEPTSSPYIDGPLKDDWTRGYQLGQRRRQEAEQ